MSTLVAYDSSSEEDEPAVAKHESAETRSTLQNGARSPSPAEQEAKSSSNAPILGPMVSADYSQDYDVYDDGDASSQLPDNERDIIRYLTQPTHPMTAMPPSPPGTPNASVTLKFKHFLALKSKGVHFNEDLASKSAFRNPAMLQALMDRAGLDSDAAYNTSLPSSVFDIGMFPDIGYKEVLLKNQQDIRAQEEHEKKALAGTGKRVIGFTSGGVSGSSSAASTPSGHQKRQKR